MANQRLDSRASLHFARGLARAFGGAIVFSLPLLMTNEMWDFGRYVERWKLALLLALSFPLFVGLSHHAGFEETFDWKEDVRDSCVAYAVAFVAAAVMLSLFGAIRIDSSLSTLTGLLALQAVPAGIGALLGRTLLTKDQSQERGWEAKYLGKLFLMASGALFLGINIAPTDEIIIITHRINEWLAIVLALVSLLLMHAFVYAVEFRGGVVIPEGGSQWSLFLRFTVTGYALALLVSFYLLWTFSRTTGLALDEIATATLVLGFPAAIGAAAARLIL
jgi:putative integral membrane protein (TIGR02587 family)